MNQPTSELDRLFIGIYPCGIVYADRLRDEHGDYARLAFLDFETLSLDIKAGCPTELQKRIKADAAIIQSKRGEQFQVSSSNQTVTLGGVKH
ncbi:MAG: hypothetical protein Q8K22_11300 [Rhodoferax sp.]|jgi:hypothetical protein|nr:hypothetical protein [Rhodoferax sp.]